jgi:bacteriorhodopsin
MAVMGHLKMPRYFFGVLIKIVIFFVTVFCSCTNSRHPEAKTAYMPSMAISASGLAYQHGAANSRGHEATAAIAEKVHF